MASIYKPTYVKTDKSGKRIKRKLRCWYIKYRDADGIERRVKGFTDKEATRQRAAELERNAARQAVGLVDPHAEHLKRPLREHLLDYKKFLIGKGNSEEYILATVSIIQRAIKGCGFGCIADLSGARFQEWIVRRRQSGTSPKTCNHYLTAMKGFGHWLVRESRMALNPLGYLSLMNDRVDIRRERRALEVDEFEKLIEVTRSNPEPFRGISGEDRAMLYLMAAYTGLRARELGSLTPESFDFGSQPSTVTLKAAYSKHRKKDVVPLRQDLAERVRAWLSTRRKEDRLWPGSRLRESAVLIRHDLKRAGIPYRDEAGRVCDFHALRHWFVSTLARSGCHPKTLQVLARHATIAMTMEKYAHLSVRDTYGALEGLPRIASGETAGTSNGPSEKNPRHVPQHAPTTDVSRRDVARTGSVAESQGDALAQLGTELPPVGNESCEIGTHAA